jgi:Flp pilus assembly protein TadB
MPSPLPILDAGDAIDSVAHVIQVALTPVFLLSGIGTLLNVFNTRLSRVSDHREHTTELLRAATDGTEKARLRAHLVRLGRRTFMLDASLVLGAVGAASACGAAFVLFLGSLRSAAIVSWLFVLFGVALACVVGALVAFLADSVLAWHGLRREGPLPHSGAPSDIHTS